MLAIRNLLLVMGWAMWALALAVVASDFFLLFSYRRALARGNPENLPAPRPPRRRLALKLAVLALVPLLLGLSVVVIPAGDAGVRVSQVSGTERGTLYPGSHFVLPLVEEVAMYDTRERVFNTAAASSAASSSASGQPFATRPQLLQVQAREGLPIGLALSVRYRLEAQRLDYIHDNLPPALDREVVAPVITSAFRDLAPGYSVRELFTTRRDEIRQQATQVIQSKLDHEGILVQEVMLRDIQLPSQYMEGLQDLLLKEQEDDRMGVETDIQQKHVRIAELQAAAEKAQAVKRAEGQAAVRVLQAKAESDAMKYTLPLKEKQIKQTRLEAQARKEATIQNAEASAQAKVIDGKAEMERRKLLATAEAERIRVVAAADAERMQSEALALRQNPLLINKIFAERLSDKIRIIMVPTDGKFFMGDLLHGATPGGNQMMPPASTDSGDDPAEGSR